ncbi:hypothetical protein [Pseudogracilibacillus auburnensis]|nr:hypothetical protein [Pseudogracilibacillus auburnensis]MBO1005046.1 hypothetical protein [Pseudogracilibacillus auburnensis]
MAEFIYLVTAFLDNFIEDVYSERIINIVRDERNEPIPNDNSNSYF